MDEIFNEYSGTLNPKKMTDEVRRAYYSWGSQLIRARKNGLTREYSPRQFIAWWLLEISKRPAWHKPTCGRKDHAKGYYFGNIRLEEQSENTAERNERRGNPGKTRAVDSICLYTGEIIGRFPSKKEAAYAHGVSEKTVYNHCIGKTKSFFKFGPSHNAPVRFKWKA